MAPTLFDALAERFARDVDLALLRAALARTPTERLRWLEEMQAFADDLRVAKTGPHEAARAHRSPR